MKTKKLALIGSGYLGKVHVECVAQIPEAEFVAFADISLPAAESCLSQYGGEYATTDAERIFADGNIDAVYICTRHDSHADLAIRAARAGKHILLEKPMSLTLEGCEAIATAVEETGVYLMPAFKMRYYPLIQMAHEFIPEPTVVVAQMMDNRWADDNWAQDPIQGGANVYSQGCHATDILRFLAGSEPQRIWAVGGAFTHPGHPCIDHCIASIQFANGHVGSWIQGDAATSAFTSKFFFELFGNGGRSVQLYDRCKKATFFDGQKSWTEERDDEEGFMLENREFIDALVNNREPELKAYDGIQATRIVLAADRAIRSGEVQTI
jgi:predicted dehydrogenase